MALRGKYWQSWSSIDLEFASCMDNWKVIEEWVIIVVQGLSYFEGLQCGTSVDHE